MGKSEPHANTEGKGIRLNERVLRDIFSWAGVIHQKKSLKAFQPHPESSKDLYLRFPPDQDCAWVRPGNEGLETSFDIFPAYASSSTSKALLYVFRFHFPPNWPGSKEKQWVAWDALQQRVTLTSTLQESCFTRIMQRKNGENFQILVEIPEEGSIRLWALQLHAMNPGGQDTPGVSFQKYGIEKGTVSTYYIGYDIQDLSAG